MDKLAQELIDVLGDDGMEFNNSAVDGMEMEEGEDEDEEDDEEVQEDDDGEAEDEEEEEEVKLKNWQLKKLAFALKSGRRKVSVSV